MHEHCEPGDALKPSAVARYVTGDAPDCPSCRVPMSVTVTGGAPWWWCSNTDGCSDGLAYRVCDRCGELKDLELMADAKLCKECKART